MREALKICRLDGYGEATTAPQAEEAAEASRV
jgi:hypothetical protein